MSAPVLADLPERDDDRKTDNAALALLSLASETLDDIEGVRVAMGNRLFAWDDNGLPDGPERQRFVLIHEALETEEKRVILELTRALRRHPLGTWMKSMVGIGPKQGPRLLAAIGDVYWNHTEDRPRRGPAELWKYCGYAPDQRKRRGERAAWNHTAKMRAYLIAEKCIMFAHSPYRAVYDATRLKLEEAVHSEPCRQCGPKGNPAEVGSPLSDGHKHARALRVVAKAVLKDMFLEARALHHGSNESQTRTVQGAQAPDQNSSESQKTCVRGENLSEIAPDHLDLESQSYDVRGDELKEAV